MVRHAPPHLTVLEQSSTVLIVTVMKKPSCLQKETDGLMVLGVCQYHLQSRDSSSAFVKALAMFFLSLILIARMMVSFV